VVLQDCEQNEIVAPLCVDEAVAVVASMVMPQTGSVTVTLAGWFMVNLLSTMQTHSADVHYSSHCHPERANGKKDCR
jgi:hypothetical protein